jgi:glycosyltransferase involved in cell wall biosynthesis
MPVDIARRRFDVPPEAFVVGVVGAVTERKHPEIALRALTSLPDKVVVFLAGSLSGGVRELVERLPDQVRGRVIMVDRHMSDSDLGAAISACNAIALLHELDGPSGVLVSAASAGVPVIVGRSRWLRKVVRVHGLGTEAAHDTDSFAEAVLRLAEVPTVPTHRQGATADDFARLLAW